MTNEGTIDRGHWPRMASIRLNKPADQLTAAEIKAVRDDIVRAKMSGELPGSGMKIL